MPMSATGPRTPERRVGGFTLIELMVALVIVATLTGLATVSLSVATDARIDTSARRLLGALRSAQQTAVLRGLDLGVRVQADRIDFLQAREGRWTTPPPDLRLAPLARPDHLRWRLEIDGREDPLLHGGDGRPQLLLLSSGELTPFRLHLGAAGTDPQAPRWALHGRLDGYLQLERPASAQRSASWSASTASR